MRLTSPWPNGDAFSDDKFTVDPDSTPGNKTQIEDAPKPNENKTESGANISTGGHNWNISAPPVFNYKPSTTVTQAESLLQQHLAQKPGEWQGGTWTDDLHETIGQILNREKFSYDLNEDALYQIYADSYITQGQQAMMDTMGKAAALTGGHGNSFAQSVGQQAYQGYLQQLNDKVPELYQLALDQHNQEGQEMYDRASLLAGMDEQEYGRYMDEVSQYYTDLNYLTENARYMSETEYQRALNDFNIKYGSYRDTVADNQWQTQFDEAQRQNAKGDLITLMTGTGYNPSDAELAATGITRQQADAYIFSYGNSQQEPETQGDRWYPTGRKDKDGNPVFTNGQGKEQAFGQYVNPHNGKTNNDTQYGVRENGYQPDNVASEYMVPYTDKNGNTTEFPDPVRGKLTDTGETDVINGERQPIYRTPDGKKWIWDDKKNKYREYEE